MLYKFSKEVIVEAENETEAWDVIAEHEATEQGILEWMMEEMDKTE